MNGKDIFLGLMYIGEDLIDEAECGKYPQKSGMEKEGRGDALRRPLFIAAVIALMALLVGCAVAYVLSLDSVKIKNTTEERNIYADNGYAVVGTETVRQSVLSLAGIKGSPAYRACADFYAYRESRVEMDDQAEKEKMAELAERYGLNPQGETLKFRTLRNLCDALGIERFFRENGGITADVDWGYADEGGNFRLGFNIHFPTDAGYELNYTVATLRWNRKDCFSQDYVTIDNTGDWTEKHYTTTSGNDILILYAPSSEFGYLLCDREEALLSLQFNYRQDSRNQAEGKVRADSTCMTEPQMELLAETMDFNIQPRLVTQADVEAQVAPSQESTQNGWTLKLRDVDTDGYVAYVCISVTAPEGVDITGCTSRVGIGGVTWNAADGKPSSGGSYSAELVEDGDGLDNTMELKLRADLHFADDGAPFSKGSTWEVGIEDIVEQTHGQNQGILAEGEWNFTIPFDETNGDYREMELVTEPIAAKGSIGWKDDGTAVLEDYTITSFVLRKYSSAIAYLEKEESISPDFYVYNGKWMYAMMKDGRKIEMMGYHDEAMDLTQVAYIAFPDGTTLQATRALDTLP